MGGGRVGLIELISAHCLSFNFSYLHDLPTDVSMYLEFLSTLQ